VVQHDRAGRFQPMVIADLLAAYLVLTKVLLIAAAILITISSIDDVFVDIWYWSRRIYRGIFVYRRHDPLTIEQLREQPEQLIAIIVPAWKEAEVIAHMVDNAVATLEYDNFVIFVGTYPNDADTQREVEIVRERHPRVQRVVTPHDGPTSKADCLNWVLQAIRLYEEDNQVEFAMLVMHDAEDVVHPLELKMFNHLIPRFDFVQLPVYPLETPWYYLTSGHYMDEFAENHGKDLVVRESLIGQVPCAGVAAGFSRKAIEKAAEASNNLVFDTSSVTEDYELTFRLHRLGITRQIFVRFGVERPVMRRQFPYLFTKPRQVRRLEFVATREFFPTSFRAAVRQKGRWIVGIVFQGWQNLGWDGSLATRYILMRDRKSIITSMVTLLGYVIAANVLVMWLLEMLFPWVFRFPPLIERGTWLEYLIWLNGVFLLNRLVQRVIFCWEVYGSYHAIMTFPRQIWGNVINFFAVLRAIRLFIGYLRTGRLIAWDKTTHAFPSVGELRSFRRRIGDLLLDRRLLTVAQLDAALARQQETAQPLGDVLLDMELVDEDALYLALSEQLGMKLQDLDWTRVAPDVLSLLSPHVAAHHFAFPISLDPDGTLEVAVSRPLPPEALDALAEAAGRPVRPTLVRRSDIGFALAHAFDKARSLNGSPLGQRLLNDGSISQEQLEVALRMQRRQYRPLGKILIQQGVLDQARIDSAIAQLARDNGERLGDLLLREGHVSSSQLEAALAEQASARRTLGELLLEQKALTEKELDTHLSAPQQRRHS